MEGYWSIPPIWVGKTVVILASGPSMNVEVADCVRRAGIPTIPINSTFRLAPWADILYAADVEWWSHPDNADAMEFAGLKVSIEPTSIRGVLSLRNLGVVGYSDDAAGLHTLGNSGAQAIQLAVKAGARRVILCGFDMHGGHWHPEHPKPLNSTSPEQYTRWIERFAGLADALEKRGVEVVNATPGSALKCFPMMSLESALAINDNCRSEVFYEGAEVVRGSKRDASESS